MAPQLDTPTGTIERPLGEFSPDIMTRLHSKGLDWQRLTGSPRFDYRIDYSDPGVDLIMKPFTYDGLAAKIRQVLDAK